MKVSLLLILILLLVVANKEAKKRKNEKEQQKSKKQMNEEQVMETKEVLEELDELDAIKELDELEEVEMIDLENSDLTLKEILKIKRAKTGSYRNFPNQSSLKQIYRRKPKYLNRGYNFTENNHDEDKMKVEMSKYLLFEQEEAKFFNKRPLPEQYHKNEIVLIPKNTDTLFTYWEIREDYYYNLSQTTKLTNENPIIILKDVDGNEKIRIQTYSRNGSMYINNIDSNQEYIVFLGYLDEFDNFIEVAHSTEANVPNPVPSENFDVKWGISEVTNVNGYQIINFRNIDKNNVASYLGYQQEVLDRELLSDEEIQSLVRKENEAHLLEGSSFNGSSSFLGSSFTGSSNIK